MEVKEKTIIDRAQYKSLLKMLNSSEEDVVMALACISKLDIKGNIIPIVMLRKEGFCSYGKWVYTCGNHTAYHESMGVNNTPAWGDVYKLIMRSPDAPKEHKKLFLQEYAKALEEIVAKMDFVESMEINIKIKDDEQ